MGIRFYCPNGHKLNVKEFQAGRRGICPFCGARTQIPLQSTRPATKARLRGAAGQAAVETVDQDDAEGQASDSSPDILPGEPPHLPGDPIGGRMLGPSTAADGPAAGPVVAPPAVSGGREANGAAAAGAGRQVAAKPVSTQGGTASNLPRTSSPLPAAPTAQPNPAHPVPAQTNTAPTNTAPTNSPKPSPVGPSAAPVQPAPPAPPPAQSSSDPADPIAEAPEAIWYIRPPSGGQFGPAPGDLMRTWLGEGRVSVDSLVWREGWRDWQEAGAIFPKLRGTQFIDVLETAPIPSVVAPMHAHPHRPKGSRSSDRTQLGLLAFLVLLVVVLVFVLLVILFK